MSQEKKVKTPLLEPFKWKKIINYLLQGLLIIAPLAITIYAIYWVVSTVDAWIPLFREPVKDLQGRITGYKVKNYGLGFVIIFCSHHCYWLPQFCFYTNPHFWFL